MSIVDKLCIVIVNFGEDPNPNPDTIVITFLSDSSPFEMGLKIILHDI